MYWKGTDIQWRQPNINMSTSEVARLFEGANLSIGIGAVRSYMAIRSAVDKRP